MNMTHGGEASRWQVVLNDEHFARVVTDGICRAHSSLLIASANVKDLHIPTGRRRAVSIVLRLAERAAAGVEVRLLHSGVPSGPFLEEIKSVPPRAFGMRRCPRVHLKAVIVDGRAMYLGSANLTGAGIGAKSSRRRNFEAGVWTTDTAAIDRVADLMDAIWTGASCPDCGRRDHCPAPLEEPWD